MKGLEGKSALVTGGSSGIGQAIAIRLGQEGVNVAVNHVGPPEGAQATKDAIEQGLEHCMQEVRDAGARAVLVEADARGRLHGRCQPRVARKAAGRAANA